MGWGLVVGANRTLERGPLNPPGHSPLRLHPMAGL